MMSLCSYLLPLVFKEFRDDSSLSNMDLIKIRNGGAVHEKQGNSSARAFQRRFIDGYPQVCPRKYDSGAMRAPSPSGCSDQARHKS